MKDWLWRLSRAVAGEPSASREVIRALKTARDKSTEIWLSPLDGGATGEATARILALERSGVRVRQLRPDGVEEPFPQSCQLRLSIQTPYGRLVGRCRITSREVHTPSSGLPFVEYLLTAPESLDAFDKRSSPRGMLGGPVVLEGELKRTQDDLAEPVRGLLGALNSVSVVLRSRNAAGRVTPGQRLYFKSFLPPPVGEVSEFVTVERIESRGGSAVIFLKFESPIPALDEALRDHAEIRRMVA
jgi:hypothetical protein